MTLLAAWTTFRVRGFRRQDRLLLLQLSRSAPAGLFGGLAAATLAAATAAAGTSIRPPATAAAAAIYLVRQAVGRVADASSGVDVDGEAELQAAPAAQVDTEFKAVEPRHEEVDLEWGAPRAIDTSNVQVRAVEMRPLGIRRRAHALRRRIHGILEVRRLRAGSCAVQCLGRLLRFDSPLASERLTHFVRSVVLGCGVLCRQTRRGVVHNR
jgi:hypothetical protein